MGRNRVKKMKRAKQRRMKRLSWVNVEGAYSWLRLLGWEGPQLRVLDEVEAKVGAKGWEGFALGLGRQIEGEGHAEGEGCYELKERGQGIGDDDG